VLLGCAVVLGKAGEVGQQAAAAVGDVGRRGRTADERLGVPWPEGLPWGDVLQRTAEQRREKLATATKAA
jgi:hypothetical protein